MAMGWCVKKQVHCYLANADTAGTCQLSSCQYEPQIVMSVENPYSKLEHDLEEILKTLEKISGYLANLNDKYYRNIH